MGAAERDNANVIVSRHYGRRICTSYIFRYCGRRDCEYHFIGIHSRTVLLQKSETSSAIDDSDDNAGKSDIFDSANRRTLVRPLPLGLHRYQRLIGSVLFCTTICMLIGCIIMAVRCIMTEGLFLVDWQC